MLLPTKHLRPERALLTIGAELLVLLREPMTPSQLWGALQKAREEDRLSWDWFVLALDALYACRLVELEGARLRRVEPAV